MWRCDVRCYHSDRYRLEYERSSAVGANINGSALVCLFFPCPDANLLLSAQLINAHHTHTHNCENTHQNKKEDAIAPSSCCSFNMTADRWLREADREESRREEGVD